MSGWKSLSRSWSKRWASCLVFGEKPLRPTKSRCAQRTEQRFRWISDWWRKYAAHQVSDVAATDPQDSLESSQLVAAALKLWHQGGAAAGDLRFWAPHAEMFDSPKAYALVIEALLDRKTLLVEWPCSCIG